MFKWCLKDFPDILSLCVFYLFFCICSGRWAEDSHGLKQVEIMLQDDLKMNEPLSIEIKFMIVWWQMYFMQIWSQHRQN